MKKIVPLTFDFIYAESPMSEMCVKTAYWRIFAIAKRNLIAKGLLRQGTHNDIDSREINVVDKHAGKFYAESNESRRIFDDKGNSGEIKAFEGDGLSHGEPERDPGSQSGDGLANKQPILN